MANTKIPSELIDGTLGVAGITSSADGTAITIDSSENVGIGTTSPSVPLTVNSQTDHSDIAIFHAGGGTPNRGLKISTFSNVSDNAGVELDAQFASGGAFKFSTGGTERVRIDNSGNVGIGTSSPTVLLDVYNGSGWGGIDVDGTSGGELRLMKSGTSYGQIYANDSSGLIINAQNGIEDIFLQAGGTTKLTINSSGCGLSAGNFTFNAGTGNLGNRYMQINAGTSNDGGFILQRDNTNQWQIVNGTTDGDLLFYSYGTSSTALYIDRSNGHVGISNTSPNNLLTVGSSSLAGYPYRHQNGTGSYYMGHGNQYYHHHEQSGASVGFYWGSACVANGGFSAYSDERLKENITTIDGALDKVALMDGITFTWKDTEARGSDKQFGVTAQNMLEVDSALPVLSGDALASQEDVENPDINTDFYTFDYARLTPYFIEAIKELKTKLEAAEARITELEG